MKPAPLKGKIWNDGTMPGSNDKDWFMLEDIRSAVLWAKEGKVCTNCGWSSKRCECSKPRWAVSFMTLDLAFEDVLK